MNENFDLYNENVINKTEEPEISIEEMEALQKKLTSYNAGKQYVLFFLIVKVLFWLVLLFLIPKSGILLFGGVFLGSIVLHSLFLVKRAFVKKFIRILYIIIICYAIGNKWTHINSPLFAYFFNLSTFVNSIIYVVSFNDLVITAVFGGFLLLNKNVRIYIDTDIRP